MTIKQLGGVFGRNPTFNDVTIEGELTFDGDIDIKSDLKIDGDLEVTGTSKLTGNVGVGKSSGSNALEVQGESLFGSGTDGIKLTYSGGNGTGIIDTGYTSTGLEFRVGNVKKLILNSSGNLEMNSGSGIDFSATGQAPGMTSELLDDYEEGTWSPAPEGGTTPGTSTIASSTAYYTKVGRCVFFDMTLQATGFNGTGNFLIAGLPFAAIGTGVCSVVANNTPWQTLSADNQNVSALPSGSYIGFRTLNRNQSGAYSIPQCAPTSTGYLRISGTYHTA
jgi:hypothetical protein